MIVMPAKFAMPEESPGVQVAVVPPVPVPEPPVPVLPPLPPDVPPDPAPGSWGTQAPKNENSARTERLPATSRVRLFMLSGWSEVEKLPTDHKERALPKEGPPPE